MSVPVFDPDQQLENLAKKTDRELLIAVATFALVSLEAQDQLRMQIRRLTYLISAVLGSILILLVALLLK